jgi:hypothetical protein
VKAVGEAERRKRVRKLKNSKIVVNCIWRVLWVPSDSHFIKFVVSSNPMLIFARFLHLLPQDLSFMWQEKQP